MVQNFSNNSMSTTFNNIYMNINKCFTIFLDVSVLLLLILSFIWSLYFIIRLVEEKKHQKYLIKMQNSAPKDGWATKIKNSQRKIIKNLFLTAICTIEWIICSSVVFAIIVFASESFIRVKHFPIPQTLHTTDLFFIFKANLYFKLLISFFLTIILLLLSLIIILTQYLCQQYSYYSDSSFKLSTKFKRVGAVLSLIFLLGLIRQAVLFQWTLALMYFTYELGSYTKATRVLCNLLYKRYFDAKIHEYQAKYVVKYYKSIYLEFKIGSIILISSLILHLICMFIFIVFSIVAVLFTSPSNWIQVLLMDAEMGSPTTLPRNVQDILSTVEKSTMLIELLLLSIGRFLLIIPYLLVSMKVLSTHLLTCIKWNNSYTNHKLIGKLIQQHNEAYFYDNPED